MSVDSKDNRKEPDKLLLNIERLANLTLSKIEEGVRDKLLTTSDFRLLVGAAIRCHRFWRELRPHNLSNVVDERIEELEKLVENKG
jgi:hypothetical protein